MGKQEIKESSLSSVLKDKSIKALSGEFLLKESLDSMPLAAILCRINSANPYNPVIIHFNNKFKDSFNLKHEKIIGKTYDFLFQDLDINYNSQNQFEYTNLVRAIRNFHSVSAIVNMELTKGKNKKIDSFKINFIPNDFKNSSDLYCIFTFEKASKDVHSKFENKVFSPNILINNLERTLQNEKLLSKISGLMVSDLPIKEIARNAARVLCEHFKVDRCILHNYNDGQTGFLVEYSSPLSKPMIINDITNDVDEQTKIQLPIVRYINFQNQLLRSFGTVHKDNAFLICEDTVGDLRFEKIRDICNEYSIASQVAIITKVNNKINGGIYIQQSSKRKWILEELELLEVVAEQFSIAIDRSYAIDKVMIINHQLLEKTLQLKKSLQEEKKMRKMQSEFMAMVSHEFKTPLQIIDGTREVLMRKLKKISSDDAVEKNLDRIKNGVVRINDLIQSIFNLSKIENYEGGVKANKSKFDIKKLINDIIEKNHSLVAEKAIDIKLIIDKLPDLYNGDAELLEHCFTNIITNAVKYSRKCGEVKIIGDYDDKAINIKVVDCGIGVPKEDLKNIGTKFFRAKNTLAVPGTGVGLYLTKYFIELHKGSITINSELNVGTTVSVILPI